MKQENRTLAAVFAAIMLLYVLFMAWYVPSVSSLRFRLQDAEESLNTNQGRERKQQHEYDEVVEQIPVVREELAQVQPLAEDARTRADELKATKKELRKEKKDLEEQIGASPENPAPEETPVQEGGRP